LWKPLEQAITRREFGKSAAKRALELKINLLTILHPLVIRHIPVTLPRAATGSVTTRKTVAINLNWQDGKTVVLVNGKKSASFSGRPKPDALEPVSKTLPPPSRNVKILFGSDPEVPFSTIVTLMDHLKKRGYNRFGFSLNLPR
jgi:biopolymer transport protein ExbD